MFRIPENSLNILFSFHKWGQKRWVLFCLEIPPLFVQHNNTAKCSETRFFCLYYDLVQYIQYRYLTSEVCSNFCILHNKFFAAIGALYRVILFNWVSPKISNDWLPTLQTPTPSTFSKCWNFQVLRLPPLPPPHFETGLSVETIREVEGASLNLSL